MKNKASVVQVGVLFQNLAKSPREIEKKCPAGQPVS
jgi:hypothetical protein